MKNTELKNIIIGYEIDGKPVAEGVDVEKATPVHMLKSRMILMFIDFWQLDDNEDEDKRKPAKMPFEEQCKRASLKRKFIEVQKDEELELTASEVSKLKECSVAYVAADQFPGDGVQLDLIEVCQEINEMAETPVEAKGPKAQSA